MVKKQVVFVETSTTAYTFKIAKTLKKRGYETVLISLMKNSNEEYFKQAFDRMTSLDAKFMPICLKTAPAILKYGFSKTKDMRKVRKFIDSLKPYVIIVKTTPNWMFIICKILFRKYPLIYFPYDIRSFCYEDKEDAASKGVPAFELWAEKYAFENADGIIHKGHDEELSLLHEKVLGKVKIKCPVIHFPPYCFKELIVPMNKNKVSKKDGEIHLAFIGHVVTNPLKEEESWENSIKDILNQNIHLHIYGKTANLKDNELKNNFAGGYLNQFLKNKYFHMIPKTFEPKELNKEISKYDYGIWMGYEHEAGDNIRLCSGNKGAAYFEAGLPFLYYKNHEFIDKLAKSYGLGLGIQPGRTRDIKKILKEFNYKVLIKRVEEARKDFELGNNINRLEKFFGMVRAYKYEKLIKGGDIAENKSGVAKVA